MFRLIRRLSLLVVTAIVLFLMMPRDARPLPPPPGGVTPAVRGVVHVHTSRSDGTGSVADVLAAAQRAGLQFVIVTDHGDGTRAPDLPDYRSGVLYIDAVEISTSGGHLVALGLPKTPYPLAGESRDVIEDVHRLGGLAIAAHPGSARAELQWQDWSAPVDGLEWLNADSEWRDERPWTLARALLTYPFRPPQALALLLDRPEPVIRQWDELTRQRPVFGVTAVDAHARIGVRSPGEPYDTAGSLHFPSYLNSFREFSIALPDVRLTGDAAVDAGAVLHAFRVGAIYSTIDALGGPAALRLSATSGTHAATMGEVLPLDGPVHLRIDAQAPADARVTLLRNGAPIATGEGSHLEHDGGAEPGVYRVEVTLPGSPGSPPVPWLLSNPIYAGLTLEPRNGPPQPVRTLTTLYSGGPARGWTVEKSAASAAAIDVIGALPGSQALLRFAISGTPSGSPYAAFVIPATKTIVDAARLVFTARADKPMRVSVQLRSPGVRDERWHRSVYLDQTTRMIDLALSDFRPRGGGGRARPVLAEVDSLLFVVDTVNTKIGSNGLIQIDNIGYAK